MEVEKTGVWDHRWSSMHILANRELDGDLPDDFEDTTKSIPRVNTTRYLISNLDVIFNLTF